MSIGDGQKVQSKEELARLEELHSYKIINTPSEKEFDDIAKLIKTLLGVPVALITFVDESTQYHKANIGIELKKMPREHTFCQYALYDKDKTLVVEDATKDDRFKDNPYVLGEKGIVFYAGHPIVTPKGWTSPPKVDSFLSVV